MAGSDFGQYVQKQGWKPHEVTSFRSGHAVTLCGMWMPSPFETWVSAHDPSRFCVSCARARLQREALAARQ